MISYTRGSRLVGNVEVSCLLVMHSGHDEGVMNGPLDQSYMAGWSSEGVNNVWYSGEVM